MKFEIDKQLKAGIINNSVFKWAAPVFLISTKHGRLCFFVDHLKLNTMQIKDSYPLPLMDEYIDSLCDSKLFPTLDAYNGYSEIFITPQDRHKTPLVCHASTYQYIRIVLGLTNAYDSYQRALDIVLPKFKWGTFPVYMDDVSIYPNTVEDRIHHFAEILTTLTEAGVPLKMNKCTFVRNNV